jgi:hypothetical protein
MTAKQAEQLREATALESMGEVPSYRDIKLPPKYAKAVLDRVEVSDRIKELESRKDELTAYLMEETAQTGLKRIAVDDFVVQIVDSDRHTLSKEKLLEAGVPASTIEACMVASHSTFLRVDDRAKSRIRGQEKREGVQSIKKGGKH